MTRQDSSLLIDQLDDNKVTVEKVESYLEMRAVAPPSVLFEVYQGEVTKTGQWDFTAVDGALGWLIVVDETTTMARTGGELRNELQQLGEALTGRDAVLTGAAQALDERLAVTDLEFAVEGITDLLSVDFV